MNTSRCKKVALFIPTLEAGGAERVAINLAKGFLATGAKVDMVIINGGGPLMKFLPKEVNIINLRRSRTIYAPFHLASYLNKTRPDALISSMNHANLVAVVAKGLARFKGKLILTEQNSISHDLLEDKRLKSKVILFLMKYLYSYADATVAVSDGILFELKSLLNLHKGVCIYNPISLNNVSANKNLKHDPYSVNGKNDPSILAIGRLSPQKNFPLLIKSIDIVRKHMPVKLDIIGEGNERNKLERLIKELDLPESVSLHGYSDHPEAWLARADIFVLSSSWEGFGLVIVEALAMGVTVVATDCHTGPAEILENGRYGYLVPVNDPEKMAEAIIFALKNPIDPDMLKKRAEEFSIPNITRQYLKVIFPDG